MSGTDVVATGIKSGEPHLGNHLGMIRPTVELSRGHNTWVVIADAHPMIRDGARSELDTHRTAAALMAAGLDGDALIYRRSDVPEAFELAWLLARLTDTDLVERGPVMSAAARFYPLVIAADVVGVGGTLVPVGPDQVADVELLEQIIRGVNARSGTGLPLPRAIDTGGPAPLPGSDGHKMSKSRSNAVPFLAHRDELIAALRRLPSGATATEGAGPDALGAVVAALAATFGLDPPPDTDPDLLVDWAVASIEAELGPVRDRYRDLLDERVTIESRMADGAARARDTVATVVSRMLRATP